jgi:hypothetical protein
MNRLTNQWINCGKPVDEQGEKPVHPAREMRTLLCEEDPDIIGINL